MQSDRRRGGPERKTQAADDETEFIMYFTTGHPPLISQTSDEEKEVKGACLYLISRK